MKFVGSLALGAAIAMVSVMLGATVDTAFLVFAIIIAGGVIGES